MTFKVKEVKEEKRLLTIDEQCLYSIANSRSHFGSMIDAAAKRCEEIHLVGVEAQPGPVNIGVFKEEIIRDATTEEEIAFNYIKFVDTCQRMRQTEGCRKCIFNQKCPLERVRMLDACKALLKGKEVYEE